MNQAREFVQQQQHQQQHVAMKARKNTQPHSNKIVLCFAFSCGSQSMCVWVGLDCVYECELVMFVIRLQRFVCPLFEYIKWIPTQAFGLVLALVLLLLLFRTQVPLWHCCSCSCLNAISVHFKMHWTKQGNDKTTKINYVISNVLFSMFLLLLRCRVALSSMPAFLSPVTAE